MVPSSNTAPPAGSSPQRIGPYLLEEELARGGQGAVFRARHAQLVVLGTLADGTRVDLTRALSTVAACPLVSIDEGGRVSPVAEGEGVLRLAAGGHETSHHRDRSPAGDGPLERELHAPGRHVARRPRLCTQEQPPKY